MTISATDLALYAGAVMILFFTPGPVWVALTARTMSGGFHAAWPLALGVVVGDVLWPILAILGVSWIVSSFAGFMTVLKFVAAAVFVWMGFLIIRNADKTIASDSRLTRPGMWAGFVAGLAVILGNPKAILFYMGVLPGFFDLTTITPPDIAAICLVSLVVPLLGNLSLALFVDRARALLTSPVALRQTNLTAGWLLVAVGFVIPFT
jgi:threonine/homoserine/homoserine lactone efflux protein